MVKKLQEPGSSSPNDKPTFFICIYLREWGLPPVPFFYFITGRLTVPFSLFYTAP
jgi:hypothetical protein